MYPTIVPSIEPFNRFAHIYAEVQQQQLPAFDAVALGTVDAENRPCVRVVLLKEFSEKGFVFYTNKSSRKGRELQARPAACLNFFWQAVQQQVRIDGFVDNLTAEEEDAYFASRPLQSQYGAWASLQSQPLDARETLERRFLDFSHKYEGKPVQRPPHWGGFRLKPDRMEFWLAHQNRLHWREEYVREGDGWKKGFLYP